jgi:hypothetical protein
MEKNGDNVLNNCITSDEKYKLRQDSSIATKIFSQVQVSYRHIQSVLLI